MISRPDRGDQVCQQTSNLAESEGDEAVPVGSGAAFAVWAVTARKACAHIARVMCRYQALYRRTW
jgi:hypothetical protein